ncbi:MAG: NAD-dependent epimerase/dehydratase [Parcubacteria group bacterium GW2011_GWA2_49_9]|nr:MAG: NAD-dependent epimerase/dehydratase [Parcubacteria group bacterium GW2011_GWA2_49_9]
MRKRTLITGASGFTGRHLAAELALDKTCELFLADRNAPNTPSPRFSVCDFSDMNAVARLMQKVRPDKVYHLIGSYTNEFNTDYSSNVLTTKNILDAVRELEGGCRVLLVGSSAEYGFPISAKLPVTEDQPCKPVSIYGLVKLFQTELMQAYIRLYRLNIVSVRPFNLLGEGVSATLFAGKMAQEIRRYMQGELREITTGKLSIRRDYIDITEAIRYYRNVMERGKAGEIYNVGSGKSTSCRELLRGMLKKKGLSFAVVREGKYGVPGKIVVPEIFADISKVTKL